MSVQRWCRAADADGVTMMVSPEGQWVAYDDHLAAIKTAEAERDTLRAAVQEQARGAAGLYAQLEAAHAELAEARALLAATGTHGACVCQTCGRSWYGQDGEPCPWCALAAASGAWAVLLGVIGVLHDVDYAAWCRLAVANADAIGDLDRALADWQPFTDSELREATGGKP